MGPLNTLQARGQAQDRQPRRGGHVRRTPHAQPEGALLAQPVERLEGRSVLGLHRLRRRPRLQAAAGSRAQRRPRRVPGKLFSDVVRFTTLT